MKNITWHNPAVKPAFGMPMCAPSSRATDVRVDAALITGLSQGFDAWSPPFS